MKKLFSMAALFVLMLSLNVHGDAPQPTKVLSADAPPEAQWVWYGNAQHKKLKLADLKIQLATATKNLSRIESSKNEYPDAAAKVAARKSQMDTIAGLKAEILLVQKADGNIAHYTSSQGEKLGTLWAKGGTIFELKPSGAIGTLPAQKLVVLQVVDKSNALVTPQTIAYTVTSTGGFSAPAGGLAEGQHGGDQGDPIWFKNIDTSKWSDGKDIAKEIEGKIWRIDGTKQYDSAGGSTKTVIVVVPFDINDWVIEQLFDAEQAADWLSNGTGPIDKNKRQQLLKDFTAWRNSMPKAEDVGKVVTTGKTMKQLERDLGTQIHVSTVANDGNTYSLRTPTYKLIIYTDANHVINNFTVLTRDQHE